jgi:L-threonylcarbamoyladenylate synthase
MSAPIVAPTAASIAQAAELLRAGELVAFPTETVYGLGADASNADAVRKIFAAKGRPADHPLIVHLYDTSALRHWARDIPASAAKLAARFWPGPLTLILPRASCVADVVTGAQDSVGVRVPSHPVARSLLAAFGGGVAAPSANRFGRISPTTARHVADDLGRAVAMIVDGGACTLGIESTIVSCIDEEPVVLRPGAIRPADLARALGRAPAARGGPVPRASGTLAVHYAPRTPATLVSAGALQSELGRLVARGQRAAVLARTAPRPERFASAWIDAPPDACAYAHELYANLRALDATGVDAILIEAVPHDDAWVAIADRLARATGGVDDDRD